MAIFTLDGKELLKIVKRGAKYYIYRLLDITISKRGTKFRWVKGAVAITPPGYEFDKDRFKSVSSSPNVYIDDVKRKTPFKICYE